MGVAPQVMDDQDLVNHGDLRISHFKTAPIYRYHWYHVQLYDYMSNMNEEFLRNATKGW